MNIQNTNFYKGDFFKDNIHGKGSYKWSNGITYEGDWVMNKMCGVGRMTWACNIVY